MFSTFRQNLSHTPGVTHGKGAAGTSPPQGPEPRSPGAQPRADFAQHPCVLCSPPPGRTPKHASSALSSSGVGGEMQAPRERQSLGARLLQLPGQLAERAPLGRGQGRPRENHEPPPQWGQAALPPAAAPASRPPGAPPGAGPRSPVEKHGLR